MDRERWRQIEDLYQAARSLPADARAQFLVSKCRGDESLRSEVESLIAQPDHTWAGPGRPGRVNDEEILGKRVGHYDVQRLLGAGGMGRVYRARDTRLGRDVALKLLFHEWTSDPDRLARLDREARLLASLNHPNIATIHGIEDANGNRALVLEFIEGDTLADRIARGPLPLSDVLAISRQVKDALDAAHEKGIVHRDLKPANIKITPAGLVKVLDFGIATLEAAPDGSTPQDSQAPTVTARGTREGVVAGTVAYMSPEQARGLAVDKRTDVWAFGCVLYEMLAGRPAFARATFTDTIAAIVERDPDWHALPRETPPGVERLIRRCLEKDRRKRLRDIGDADAEAANVPAPERRRLLSPLAVAAAAAVIVAISAALTLLRTESPPHPTGSISLALLPPDEQRFLFAPVPSPDGTRLVFAAAAPNGRTALWMRPIGDTAATRLAGTEDAARPFWSPEGRFIGFGADGSLKRIDVDAGTIQTICVCAPELLGGTWGPNGVIVFAPANRAPLLRVAAAGSTPEPITKLDSDRNENSHRWPQFLPDGRRLLYTARSDVTGNTGIYVLEIDSGKRQWLFAAQSHAMYVPSGHLLFVRERALLAQPFDPTTGQIAGEPVPTAIVLEQNPTGASASFNVSSNGEVLTYRVGSRESRQLVAFDRAGNRRSAIGSEDAWQDLKLSPDGKRAALVRTNDVSGNRDIWLMDVASGRVVRWSSHPANDWRPVWSPDGQTIAFASDRNGASAIFRRRVDGSGDDQLVLAAAGAAEGRFPDDWSRDDRLVFLQDSPLGTAEIWTGLASGVGRPAALKRGTYVYGGSRLSPDQRWLAYVSNESGGLEVYVTSIDGSLKHRVSSAGGTHPRWRRDSGELLYYAPGDNALMSVPVKVGTFFEAGSAERLFQTCLNTPPPFYQSGYELADGGTTLWICPGNQQAPGTVTVAVGWSAALASRAH